MNSLEFIEKEIENAKELLQRLEKLKVNSNAQLYKQAGNSIVVTVLMNIFKQLL